MKTNHQNLSIVALCIGLLLSSIVMFYIPPTYSQKQQDSLFQSEATAIDDMASRKVKVGDIELAYKQIGNTTDKPIILINWLGVTMDMWSPTLLKVLSSNQTVIIFDNRGAGESSTGTREFSMDHSANDTLGLLDALKIPRADLLGFSMGSFIVQELALKIPDRVNNLILYASICGSNETIASSPEATQLFHNISNTLTPKPEQKAKFITLMFPSEWLKANPNYEKYMYQFLQNQ